MLVFWKERGLGGIPALGLEETRLAVGAATTAISVDLDQYFDFDLDHWLEQMDYMREFFFSARVAQWAPIAGLIAVLRVRRGAIAALLAGWLAAFLVVKGFSPRADIQAGTLLAAAHAGVARIPAPVRRDPAARADTGAAARRPPARAVVTHPSRAAGSSSSPC